MKRKKSNILQGFLWVSGALLGFILLSFLFSFFLFQHDTCSEDFINLYNTGLDKGDYSVCEQFESRGYYVNRKINLLGCDLPDGTSITRNDCYFDFARNAYDVSLCLKIDHYGNQSGCFFELAKHSDNIAVCESAILDQDDPYYQSGIDYRDECYAALSKELNDVAICDNIRNEQSRSFCLRVKALDQDNTAYCDEQEDPRTVYQCYSAMASTGSYDDNPENQATILARQKITMDLCLKIDQTDQVQDFCIMEAILYSGNKSICNREDVPKKKRFTEACDQIGAFS